MAARSRWITLDLLSALSDLGGSACTVTRRPETVIFTSSLATPGMSSTATKLASVSMTSSAGVRVSVQAAV